MLIKFAEDSQRASMSREGGTPSMGSDDRASKDSPATIPKIESQITQKLDMAEVNINCSA